MHWTPEGNTDHQVTCRIVSTVRFAEEACAVLLSVKFEPCHYVVNPEPYVKNCRYDVCSCADGQECLCDAVRSYAAACAAKGVLVNWRGHGYCGISHSVCLNAIYNIFFLSIFIFILSYFSVQMYHHSEIEIHLLENRRLYDLFSEKYIQIKQVFDYNKKKISASVVRFIF